MDFRLNEEQLALQAAARKYARERLLPLAAETERSGTPPSHELIREYAEMGFLGINVATEYGGLGLGNLEALLVLRKPILNSFLEDGKIGFRHEITFNRI